MGSDNQRDYLFLDFGKTAEDPDKLALPDQIMLSSITDSSGTIQLLPEKKAKSSGQFGVTLKYYAEWLNNGTELALYAGRYHSRLPYLSFYEGDYGCLSGPGALTPAAIGPNKTTQDTLGVMGACPGLDTSLFIGSALPAGAAPPVRDQMIGTNGNAFVLDTAKAQLVFPENIDLYGFSFNTAFGDLSFQGEVAYRPNQPLQVDDTDLAFAALQNIFPRGNGSGAQGDSYDFGLGGALPGVPAALANAGTLAQLPGARYGIPDFISAYRGLDPLSYKPGQYIRGYERFKTANYDLGATNVIGPNNWVGANQIILIGELGASQIFDLPGLDKLQIEGPGTFTHASAGADGTGADGSAQSNSAVIGASGIRFNPTQTTKGFTTDFAYGYRVIAILRYENVLPGIGVEPTIIWSQDLHGVSPGPGENFVEGRKTVISSVVVPPHHGLERGGGLHRVLRRRQPQPAARPRFRAGRPALPVLARKALRRPSRSSAAAAALWPWYCALNDNRQLAIGRNDIGHDSVQKPGRSMKLTSKTFSDGGVIPGRCAFAVKAPRGHVRFSDNLNPELSWSGIPAGTKSFALVCIDPDAPTRPDDVNKEDREVPLKLPRAHSRTGP